ncbi:hypothetical protein K491DRAFT_643854, partial [Lophiostoma macrostomum CBS 122681]
MIDPISALSVAAAAVQFVDFSRKLVCKSKELYNSLDGVLRDNEKTETVTMRLKGMAQELQPPRKSVRSVASGKASTPKTSARLQSICTECNEVSDELVDHLRRLRVPDGSVGRKWKSFRQALKSVWSKKEIDRMAQRLASLRAEIDTEDLGQEQKSEFGRLGALSINQSSRFQKLDENEKKIIVALTNKQVHADSQGDEFVWDKISERPKIDGTPWTRKAAIALVKHDGEKRASRIHLDILESLRFPEMTHRHDGIAKAHAETFKWIFEDPTKYYKPWDSFSQWLSQRSELYWIQGKPAAGKSTLMRYIWHHSSTFNKLKAWSRDSALIIGAFFFWNSGSEEQRSQTGLFRTLLYEVLQDHRDLISQVFPEEWTRKCDLVANDMTIAPERWSQDRLQRAFKILVGLANPGLKFCFFIDGLDEYDGDYGDIAEYIEVLSKKSPHAKFCVSSRPLPVIQQVFVGVCGLKLQDLTADDIKRYVSDKLESDRNMQRLLQKDPNDGNLLINEIVDKASGVFLWVTLVVKSLIRGLRNGDDMSHLLQRLFHLPPDLEQLFRHILERIEPEYREESSKIFQIFRTSGNKLNILELYRTLLFADHRDAIELAIEGETTFSSQTYKEGIEQLAEQMTRRLDSRCRGLIEICDYSSTTHLQDIVYLHRTARDYLEQPHVWSRILDCTASSGFDPSFSLLMSYVVLVKT